MNNDGMKFVRSFVNTSRGLIFTKQITNFLRSSFVGVPCHKNVKGILG
jgi:hypothetical protein